MRGQTIWFASEDVELQPRPEAALCLLAFACQAQGLSLTVPVAVEPGFGANLRSALDLVRGWWGYGPASIEGLAAAAAPRPPPDRGADDRLGLFFSGGADSCYSLLRGPEVELAVYVAGFEIGVDRRDEVRALLPGYRRLAAERGARLVTVWTNLRRHLDYRDLGWIRSHGAATAAVGHLLTGHVDRMLISASYQLGNLMPWGTHPDLDWRWSGPDMAFEHYGAEVRRGHKLVALRDEPTVHQVLRICFWDRGSNRNCGRCEKCVRTRLVYRFLLPGVRLETMPDDAGLPAAIDGLRPLHSHGLCEVYRRLLADGGGEGPECDAIRRLLARSPAPERG